MCVQIYCDAYNQPEEYIGGFGSGSSIGSSYFGGGYKIESSYGYFKGEVITLPLNIKWEFRIWKNFSGNLNLGLNYNFETESNYFSTNIDDFEKYSAKEYSSYNTGFGFNYFISKKKAVFVNIESYIGGTRGQTESFIFSKPIYNTNTLINFGYKYNFKK